jgi:hypothetical protein
MRRAVALALSMGVLGAFAACDGCDGPPSKLRVGGDHPYVRCLLADPPTAGEVRAGGVQLVIEERTATVVAPEGPLRIAAFAGPAPSNAGLVDLVRALGAGRPHLVLVVGNLGDTVEAAERNLGALGGAGVPVLVMAGGRDDATVWSRVWSSLDEGARARVVDVRGLWRLVSAQGEALLVSGAPGGRYARSDTSCGFGAEDLAALGKAWGQGGGTRRTLVSWAAPAGFGATGIGGRDGGDPGLGELAARLGVGEALHAWPAPASARLGEGERGRSRVLARAGAERPETAAIMLTWSAEGLIAAPVQNQERRRSSSP